MKKSWGKPELIVLVRRRSDEVILMGCKEGSNITNMNSTKGGCLPNTYVQPPGEWICSGTKCKL